MEALQEVIEKAKKYDELLKKRRENQKVVYKKHAEKIKAYQRDYYAKNKEKVITRCNEYYKRNKDARREYYLKNRERILAKARQARLERQNKENQEEPVVQDDDVKNVPEDEN